jgi:hypothetical protein
MKIEMPSNAGDVCMNALAREQGFESLEMVRDEDISTALFGYRLGISYANEQLGKAAPPEPWKPTKGMKCAFWCTGYEEACTFGSYGEASDGSFGPSWSNDDYDHCSELLSLDEIGKPPQYFIERDERHV